MVFNSTGVCVYSWVVFRHDVSQDSLRQMWLWEWSTECEREGGGEKKAQKVWQRGINCLKKYCKRQMWWRKCGYTQQAFYSLLKQPVNCPIGCDMDSAVNFLCTDVPACSSHEAWTPVHWWYSLIHEWIGLDESESLIRERSGGLVHCCRTISCTGTWPRATQANRCWDLATTRSAEMSWHTQAQKPLEFQYLFQQSLNQSCWFTFRETGAKVTRHAKITGSTCDSQTPSAI